MGKNVTSIAAKEQQKFKNKYDRLAISCASFEELASEHEEYVAEDGEPFSLPGAVLKRLKDYPDKELSKVGSAALAGPTSKFNQASLVAALGKQYGSPDITCSTEWLGRPDFPLGWGYPLSLSHNLIAVIAGKLRETKVLFFKRSVGRAELSPTDEKQVDEFLSDLKSFHESAGKQFKGAPFVHNVGYINLYYEKYSAGQLMLRLATDGDTEKRLDLWALDAIIHEEGEPKNASRGFLELSAGVFFFMALEALINLTYALFIREPIRQSLPLLLKQEIQTRMSCMHLLCDEFDDEILFDKGLQERVRAFKEWRNKVVHADVTEDDVTVFSWLESDVPVYFAPALDHRGQEESSQEIHFPRFQATIATEDVIAMKRIVDDCKSAIMSRLSERGKEEFSQVDNSAAILRVQLF